MTGQDLKNSILQLAIQGKLVPQDPHDEPASVLLERIRKEKDRLIKEKKIKKEKPLAPITEDEKPFEIPESWEWVRLGEITSLLGDGIHGTPNYDESGDVYFINGNNLSNGKIIIKPDTKKVNREEAELHRRTLTLRTVLVSINGTIGNIAFYNGENVILGKSACYFNLLDKIRRDYLQIVLSTDYFIKYAMETATGSTIKNVPLAGMKSFVIPLPPLAEQRRIVAKIEELMPMVEEYGKAQSELDALNKTLPEQLKQSILQEAIQGKLGTNNPEDEPASELLARIRKEKAQLIKEKKIKKEKPLPEITDEEKPFDIPKNWEWCRLGDYCERITDQVASGSFATLRENVKSLKTPDYAIMVKTADFSNNFTRNLTYTDEHGYKFLENSNLFGGELILSNIGSIGKVFIVPKLSQPMTLAPNSVMVRLLSEGYRDYLLHFLLSPIGFQELMAITSGTAMKKFNKTDLKTILIPLPPLAEQHRIVEKLDALLPKISELNKQ